MTDMHQIRSIICDAEARNKFKQLASIWMCSFPTSNRPYSSAPDSFIPMVGPRYIPSVSCAITATLYCTLVRKSPSANHPLEIALEAEERSIVSASKIFISFCSLVLRRFSRPRSVVLVPLGVFANKEPIKGPTNLSDHRIPGRIWASLHHELPCDDGYAEKIGMRWTFGQQRFPSQSVN